MDDSQSKKRQNPCADSIHAAKRSNPSAEPSGVDQMRWPCTLEVDTPINGGQVSWHSATFIIKRSDIEPKLAPLIVNADGHTVHSLHHISEAKMPFDPFRSDMYHYNGFCMRQDTTDAEPCIHVAERIIFGNYSSFGHDLAGALCSVIKLAFKHDIPLVGTDKAQSEFFKAQDLCKHDVPLAGSNDFTTAELSLVPNQECGKIRVLVVENDLKTPCKVNAYTLLLAVDQILRQPAPVELRTHFLPVLNYDADFLDSQDRVEWVTNPNSQNILVGDLIPMVDSSQKYMFLQKLDYSSAPVLKLALDHGEFAFDATRPLNRHQFGHLVKFVQDS